PEGIKAVINENSIKILPIFEYMSKYVEHEEMMRTFNMGVGMVWAVDAKDVDAIVESTDAYVIGHLENGEREVVFV
ncbi:MAG TPA: phosphoribosylformylglycinamidine cyclo-ligase, partial [Nitratifractor sp.]|nr:phosphoribosylformylglycinamidine cyclo-ligase [Nitratifractor sp.]